jgi:hypothetical protein
MDEISLIEGAVLGVSTAIFIKYGVSLDPINYGIMIINAINNTTLFFPNAANSAINVSGFVNYMIIILTILGIVILIASLWDVYCKIKDNEINLQLFVVGFLFGFFLILIA